MYLFSRVLSPSVTGPVWLPGWVGSEQPHGEGAAVLDGVGMGTRNNFV